MRAIGLSLGLARAGVSGAGGGGAPSYDADAAAYFAAMSVQPNEARKGLLNDLIVGLKVDGVWASLDWLLICAAHHEQAGRLNARKPAKVGTVREQIGGTRTQQPFAVDRGWQPTGLGFYLDFNERYDAAGNLFAQNNAHISAWNNTATSPQEWLMGQYLGGQNTAIGSTNNAATVRISLNGTGAKIAHPIMTGHRLASRSSSAQHIAYFNGAAPVTVTAASVAPAAGNAALLVADTTAGSDRVAAATSGAALSAPLALAVYGRLNTYLSAVGGA